MSHSLHTLASIYYYLDDSNTYWGQWNLGVVLIFISMMTKDTEYFHYLLAISIFVL